MVNNITQQLELIKLQENDVDKFYCDVCGDTFYRKYEIEHHLDVHARTCDICFKVANTKAELNQHLQIHLAGNKFLCDICGYTFNHKYKIEKHIRKHAKASSCQISTDDAYKHKAHMFQRAFSNIMKSRKAAPTNTRCSKNYNVFTNNFYR